MWKLFCCARIGLRCNRLFLVEFVVGFRVDVKWNFHIRFELLDGGNNFVVFGSGCNSMEMFLSVLCSIMVFLLVEFAGSGQLSFNWTYVDVMGSDYGSTEHVFFEFELTLNGVFRFVLCTTQCLEKQFVILSFA